MLLPHLPWHALPTTTQGLPETTTTYLNNSTNSNMEWQGQCFHDKMMVFYFILFYKQVLLGLFHPYYCLIKHYI